MNALDKYCRYVTTTISFIQITVTTSVFIRTYEQNKSLKKWLKCKS